jgi:hypothetical protein
MSLAMSQTDMSDGLSAGACMSLIIYLLLLPPLIYPIACFFGLPIATHSNMQEYKHLCIYLFNLFQRGWKCRNYPEFHH